MSAAGPFAALSDDLVLAILSKLDDDPRDWARLACVSPRFASLLRGVLLPSKCTFSIPAVVADLLSASVAGDPPGGWAALHKLSVCCPGLLHTGVGHTAGDRPGLTKRRRMMQCIPSSSSSSSRSHMAAGAWNLSREQGNKLLASRFRNDCLYICDWPGCLHAEEKRDYMLFRGVFKNFKLSRVWNTIKDGSKSKLDLECAFCACKVTWDLRTAACLRSFFGHHDDGEPVVRAYVCENGHVSGAWTRRPLYT